MTENFKTENGKQVPVYPDRFPLWQGSFKIHTFEEELQFVRGLEKSSGKRIGIYPKSKRRGCTTKKAKTSPAPRWQC